MQVFKFAGEVTRVAIRPALGRTVRFLKPLSSRVFVLLFETTPPVIGLSGSSSFFIDRKDMEASIELTRPNVNSDK